MTETPRIRWFPGLVAAVALSLVAFYPQMKFWSEEGFEWPGTYAYTQPDEPFYEAYLSALLAGRPRRNDPFSGYDEAPGSPQPETYLSIQFVPPYLLLFIARACGLSASEMFLALLPLAAFLSTLTIFWLIATITRNEWLAAAGALCILCLGTAAAMEGVIRDVLGLARHFDPDYLPFLRRYQPAATFPLFFLLCGTTWHALVGRGRFARFVSPGMTGIIFALLVFSYLFLWTAAAAWLACLALIWLAARPQDWRLLTARLTPVALVACGALIPYLLMLGNRAQNTEQVLMFETGHAPDLFRAPTLIGAVVILLLIYKLRARPGGWREYRVLFALSFALLPLVVFNQQVFTGRIFQPIHYQTYVANYVSLLSAVVALPVIVRTPPSFLRGIPRPALALIVAALALYCGYAEAERAARRKAEQNSTRRDLFHIARTLREISDNDRPGRQVVFSPSTHVTNNLPAVAPQAVLWSTLTYIFPGVSPRERKERFYQHLFFSDVAPRQLYWALRYKAFEPINALFDMGRAAPVLVTNYEPLTEQEIEDAVRGYADYISAFDRERAARFELSYLILSPGDPTELQNLSRWYERESLKAVGSVKLFRLRLRD